MRISQILLPGAGRAGLVREGGKACLVPGVSTTIELALEAFEAGRNLKQEIEFRGPGEGVDLAAALADGRMLLPIDHPDPAHMHLTGTGLTHTGSAAASENSKPGPGDIGGQPEWFYKGNGYCAANPGASLISPSFASDTREVPAIAGIYMIDEDGRPLRLGFALANEPSDHVTERPDYLWPAHSRLRPASFGPELLTGELPRHVEGTSRIIRNGATVLERTFLSGEDNMSYSIASLEHHHFKYEVFRQPGDVHIHFFRTATPSPADGIKVQSGDEFEVTCDILGLPLRNAFEQQPGAAEPVLVRVL